MSFDIFKNEKFTRLITKWLSDESEEFSYKNLGESILNLLIDLELANKQIFNADITVRKQIQKELIEKNKFVPRVGGNQTIGQEAIYKFLIEDFDGGVNLLINSIREKEINIKEHISEAQREKARKPRPDALTEVLTEILEENPKITEPEVIELLKAPYSNYVYIEDENVGITIESESGIETFPISGLKNRLYRLRIKLNLK